jgi:hypothetical protein
MQARPCALMASPAGGLTMASNGEGGTTSSSAPAQGAAKPRVSNAWLIGEVLAGTVAMPVVEWFAVVVCLRWLWEQDAMARWQFVMCIAVVPLVASGTVYLIGRAAGHTGSFPATLFWSVLGGCLAWAACLYLRSCIGVLLAPASACAVAGFNHPHSSLRGSRSIAG